MDLKLWSDDPAERLRVAQALSSTELPKQLAEGAPKPAWPYAMPTSVNPFVVFIGASPGNSPPPGEVHKSCGAYPWPTVGQRHPGVDDEDGSGYWNKVRWLAENIIQSHSSARLSDPLALFGQLNLGTGRSGEAKEAPIERRFCEWVPKVVLKDLRPAYVILMGLKGHLTRTGSEPSRMFSELKIDWRNPDEITPFSADTRYSFSLWRRVRPDGKPITFVLWPQQPGRPPMRPLEVWQAAGDQFVRMVGKSPSGESHQKHVRYST